MRSKSAILNLDDIAPQLYSSLLQTKPSTGLNVRLGVEKKYLPLG